MAAQNLVSAELNEETKTKIAQGVALIKEALSFAISLPPPDKRWFIKAGDNYLPFIKRAHEAVGLHPEMMSGIFSIPEFKKDYTLHTELPNVRNQLIELTEAVDNALFAASSDSFVEALQVYAAVQQNKDTIPGLKAIADEMAEFFKKTKKSTTEPKPDEQK